MRDKANKFQSHNFINTQTSRGWADDRREDEKREDEDEAKACEGVGCPINIYDYKIYIHIFRRRALRDPCPTSGTCLVSVYYDYDTNLRLGTIKRERGRASIRSVEQVELFSDLS